MRAPYVPPNLSHLLQLQPSDLLNAKSPDLLMPHLSTLLFGDFSDLDNQNALKHVILLNQYAGQYLLNSQDYYAQTIEQLERKVTFQTNQLVAAEQRITILLNEMKDLTDTKPRQMEFELQVEKLKEENFMLKNEMQQERGKFQKQIFDVENQNQCEFCNKRFQNSLFLSEHVMRRHEAVYGAWAAKVIGADDQNFEESQKQFPQHHASLTHNNDYNISMLEIQPADAPKIPFIAVRESPQSPCYANYQVQVDVPTEPESSEIFITQKPEIQRNIQIPVSENFPNKKFGESGNLEPQNATISTFEKAANHINDFNEFLRQNENFMLNNSLAATVRSEALPDSFESNSETVINTILSEFEGERIKVVD
ncbi:hypothetical protein SS50377_25045 [Spironucleus salmonicida]|uniref:C2H2-type domain-containing protein n=1 Tax=Spironucleus salmonicida TaxID=348837 RepID=V6LFN0_9EUKA|nr:hypothetical protein SS50377_25045 [Spironucleus salmonicida]|eukprot:EST43098.1 Hypothetical protein SS50377_17255 [Spironucleus salmonicida]